MLLKNPVRRICMILASLLVAASGLLHLANASQTPDRKTVWSGVYTDAQASRGEAVYLENCAPCHGVNLDGVAYLKGSDFMERWRELNVRGLFDFMSKSMPRPRRGSSNRPGSLSEDTYVDIIAYIFRSNGFPAGSQELTTGVMKNIQIEMIDGPKPLPNSALVQSVGCMTRRGADWFLTRASEPKRVPSSDPPTPEELEEAKTTPAGDLQFLLTNLGLVSAEFDPATHANQKIMTRGLLSKQPGNNRISVTSLQMIEETCR